MLGTSGLQVSGLAVLSIVHGTNWYYTMFMNQPVHSNVHGTNRYYTLVYNVHEPTGTKQCSWNFNYTSGVLTTGDTPYRKRGHTCNL